MNIGTGIAVAGVAAAAACVAIFARPDAAAGMAGFAFVGWFLWLIFKS